VSARPLVALLALIAMSCSEAATVERAGTTVTSDERRTPPTDVEPSGGTTVESSGPSAGGERTAPSHPTNTEGDQEAGSVTSISSHSRTTISTDAGTVEATFLDGELLVEVDSRPGWTAEVRRRSPDAVEVTWTSPNRTVHADVTASERGISSSTRSVSSSG
jgi:hypothetical protein